MRTEQNGPVTSIYVDDAVSGWEQWLFLTSDNHFDSAQCNRDWMHSDFQEAKRRRARILVVGDFFDAMQGHFDPRRSMDELRPEYRRNDYYDFVVQDAADWLEPFSGCIDVLADGNHENAVLKNANTNLADRLTHELNTRYGMQVRHGGYGGWVRWMFNTPPTPGKSTITPRTSVKIKYFHGSGGEAPVTRGAIQTSRQAVYLPDANIVVNGHSHNAYYIPITRERCGGKGTIFFDTQHHIRIPGYKQGYGDGSGGWEITRGGVPKPIGSMWVKMTYVDGVVNIDVQACIHNPVPVDLSPNPYTGKVYAQDTEVE